MSIIYDKYCIYIHTTPSNKAYIGITCQKPEHRWNNGRGYRQHKYFYSAIQKYGWDNIEHYIFAEDLSKEEACRIEQLLIALFNTTDRLYGYNISVGGDVGNRGCHLSEETRERLRQTSTGRVKSREEIEKIRQGHLGKVLSEETKRKLSIINTGKKLSDETKLKISMSGKGKVISEETKNKLRESKKRENLSDETRKKISESKFKPCMCVETGQCFTSLKQASEITGISRTSLTNVLCGRSKTAGGYHWRYYNED